MGKEIMIKLGECELDYPSITRFKVWVGKVYMGEYGRTEVLNRFGEMWLDRAHEEGVREVEIWKSGKLSQKHP